MKNTLLAVVLCVLLKRGLSDLESHRRSNFLPQNAQFDQDYNDIDSGLTSDSGLTTLFQKNREYLPPEKTSSNEKPSKSSSDLDIEVSHRNSVVVNNNEPDSDSGGKKHQEQLRGNSQKKGHKYITAVKSSKLQKNDIDIVEVTPSVELDITNEALFSSRSANVTHTGYHYDRPKTSFQLPTQKSKVDLSSRGKLRQNVDAQDSDNTHEWHSITLHSNAIQKDENQNTESSKERSSSGASSNTKSSSTSTGNDYAVHHHGHVQQYSQTKENGISNQIHHSDNHNKFDHRQQEGYLPPNDPGNQQHIRDHKKEYLPPHPINHIPNERNEEHFPHHAPSEGYVSPNKLDQSTKQKEQTPIALSDNNAHHHEKYLPPNISKSKPLEEGILNVNQNEEIPANNKQVSHSVKNQPPHNQGYLPPHPKDLKTNPLYNGELSSHKHSQGYLPPNNQNLPNREHISQSPAQKYLPPNQKHHDHIAHHRVKGYLPPKTTRHEHGGYLPPNYKDDKHSSLAARDQTSQDHERTQGYLPPIHSHNEHNSHFNKQHSSHLPTQQKAYLPPNGKHQGHSPHSVGRPISYKHGQSQEYLSLRDKPHRHIASADNNQTTHHHSRQESLSLSIGKQNDLSSLRDQTSNIETRGYLPPKRKDQEHHFTIPFRGHIFQHHGQREGYLPPDHQNHISESNENTLPITDNRERGYLPPSNQNREHNDVPVKDHSPHYHIKHEEYISPSRTHYKTNSHSSDESSEGQKYLTPNHKRLSGSDGHGHADSNPLRHHIDFQRYLPANHKNEEHPVSNQVFHPPMQQDGHLVTPSNNPNEHTDFVPNDYYSIQPNQHRDYLPPDHPNPEVITSFITNDANDAHNSHHDEPYGTPNDNNVYISPTQLPPQSDSDVKNLFPFASSGDSIVGNNFGAQTSFNTQSSHDSFFRNLPFLNSVNKYPEPPANKFQFSQQNPHEGNVSPNAPIPFLDAESPKIDMTGSHRNTLNTNGHFLPLQAELPFTDLHITDNTNTELVTPILGPENHNHHIHPDYSSIDWIKPSIDITHFPSTENGPLSSLTNSLLSEVNVKQDSSDQISPPEGYRSINGPPIKTQFVNSLRYNSQSGNLQLNDYHETSPLAGQFSTGVQKKQLKENHLVKHELHNLSQIRNIRVPASANVDPQNSEQSDHQQPTDIPHNEYIPPSSVSDQIFRSPPNNRNVIPRQPHILPSFDNNQDVEPDNFAPQLNYLSYPQIPQFEQSYLPPTQPSIKSSELTRGPSEDVSQETLSNQRYLPPRKTRFRPISHLNIKNAKSAHSDHEKTQYHRNYLPPTPEQGILKNYPNPKQNILSHKGVSKYQSFYSSPRSPNSGSTNGLSHPRSLPSPSQSFKENAFSQRHPNIHNHGAPKHLGNHQSYKYSTSSNGPEQVLLPPVTSSVGRNLPYQQPTHAEETFHNLNNPAFLVSEHPINSQSGEVLSHNPLSAPTISNTQNYVPQTSLDEGVSHNQYAGNFLPLTQNDAQQKPSIDLLPPPANKNKRPQVPLSQEDNGSHNLSNQGNHLSSNSLDKNVLRSYLNQEGQRLPEIRDEGKSQQLHYDFFPQTSSAINDARSHRRFPTSNLREPPPTVASLINNAHNVNAEAIQQDSRTASPNLISKRPSDIAPIFSEDLSSTIANRPNFSFGTEQSPSEDDIMTHNLESQFSEKGHLNVALPVPQIGYFFVEGKEKNPQPDSKFLLPAISIPTLLKPNTLSTGQVEYQTPKDIQSNLHTHPIFDTFEDMINQQKTLSSNYYMFNNVPQDFGLPKDQSSREKNTNFPESKNITKQKFILPDMLPNRGISLQNIARTQTNRHALGEFSQPLNKVQGEQSTNDHFQTPSAPLQDPTNALSPSPSPASPPTYLRTVSPTDRYNASPDNYLTIESHQNPSEKSPSETENNALTINLDAIGNIFVPQVPNSIQDGPHNEATSQLIDQQLTEAAQNTLTRLSSTAAPRVPVEEFANLENNELEQGKPTIQGHVRTVQIINNLRNSIKNIKVLETADSSGVKTINILGSSNEEPTGKHKVVHVVNESNPDKGVIQTVKIFADHKPVTVPKSTKTRRESYTRVKRSHHKQLKP